jgi:polygalacturonase
MPAPSPLTAPLDILAEADRVAASVASPRIPDDRTVLLSALTSFAPNPAGTHDFRPHIQRALDELAAAGGGTLVLGHPKGAKAWMKSPVTYRCAGPLQLRSRVRLALEPSTRLFFPFAPAAYTDDGRGHLTRYEGTLLHGPSACLRAFACHDVEVVGLPGSGATPEIDGDGFAWQRWMEAGEGDRQARGLVPSYQRLKTEVNNAALPLAERRCADVTEWFLRPELFQSLACSRVALRNLRLTHSPFWCVHPVWTEDATFQDLTFNARALNNDGIDPESCRRVLIERVVFDNADDNVAIKAGRDREAREGLDLRGSLLEHVASPWIVGGRSRDGASEIVVRHCCFKGHYAVCVGSEAGGGAHDIYVVDNLAPQDVKMVFNLKSSRSRGGVVERVYVKNLRAHRVGDCVVCLVPNYDNDSTSPHPPTFRDIWIEDVHVTHARHGIAVYGWPDSLTRRVSIKSLHVANLGGDALKANHVENLRLEDVVLGGRVLDGEHTISDTAVPTPVKI